MKNKYIIYKDTFINGEHINIKFLDSITDTPNTTQMKYYSSLFN